VCFDVEPKLAGLGLDCEQVFHKVNSKWEYIGLSRCR
jgi:hypothetical protein